MNPRQVAAAYGLSYAAARKRMQRGMALDRPYRPRRPRQRCPIAVAFKAWRRREPLAFAGGVRCNLRGAL